MAVLHTVAWVEFSPAVSLAMGYVGADPGQPGILETVREEQRHREIKATISSVGSPAFRKTLQRAPTLRSANELRASIAGTAPARCYRRRVSGSGFPRTDQRGEVTEGSFAAISGVRHDRRPSESKLAGIISSTEVVTDVCIPRSMALGCARRTAPTWLCRGGGLQRGRALADAASSSMTQFPYCATARFGTRMGEDPDIAEAG